MKGLLDLLVGDPQADRVVPPTGMTARLTVFVAGVMAFLAVIVLAMSLTAGRVADRWANELAEAATLRLPAAASDADVALALEILDQTPGVAAARAFDDAEQKALLSPWLGADLDLAELPVPQLIEVIAGNPAYDVDGLRARLAAELPDATLDDHAAWREPLVAAATRLRIIGVGVIILIGAAMAAMITLAAQATLAANVQVIKVLRLVGARDVYIARAFVRRQTLRAGLGAIMGCGLGAALVLVLPHDADAGGFMTQIGFGGFGWLWPLVIPLLAAIVAFLATRSAAFARLREQR